ncbi:glycosyl hydrolase [Catenuloplanes atrovinosus]|uniref:Chitinase n=1 Tax=Catenuloplanes atrovinosus TaxID=137266 RepID=A0AAE3YVQ6_9ACTN|nr:glycosyl hydrolase [Catenuloplanes atrovinosus]MDR7279415.1 chitinase [Catenuloplanes atrovinosus]
MPWKRPAALASALLLATACTTATACATDVPAPAPRPRVAPYIDLASGTLDIAAAVRESGQTDFTLAFVVADRAGTCAPTWGGTIGLTAAPVQADLDEIARLGGEVTVSTGGATGTYLEAVCSRAELTGAYRAALDAAGSNALDVDIERPVTPSTVTGALADLQRERGTAVTLTVPVAGVAQGLTDESAALLRGAKAAGVELSVNAMTMNFDPAGADWGDAMTAATDAVAADLAAIWPERDRAAIHRMLGVTPMIGVNDTGPVTTLADAETVLRHAEERGLGFVRFWSVNRDNDGCAGTVSPSCSGIAQSEFEFTRLFGGGR